MVALLKGTGVTVQEIEKALGLDGGKDTKERPMAKKALPKRIYVKWEVGESSTWLQADETTEAMEDGDKVGIYELIESKTMRVTKALK